MNTAQTIKTIIKAITNEITDRNELEDILKVLYEIESELDMELYIHHYKDEDDDEEEEFEGTEFPKLKKPAAPFGIKKLPKDYKIK